MNKKITIIIISLLLIGVVFAQVVIIASPELKAKIQDDLLKAGINSKIVDIIVQPTINQLQIGKDGKPITTTKTIPNDNPLIQQITYTDEKTKQSETIVRIKNG